MTILPLLIRFAHSRKTVEIRDVMVKTRLTPKIALAKGVSMLLRGNRSDTGDMIAAVAIESFFTVVVAQLQSQK